MANYRLLGLSLGLLLCSGSAVAKEAEVDKEIQLKIKKTMNASGAAIDRCTQDHVQRNGEQGQATLQMTVMASGKMTAVKVRSKLRPVDKLHYCLGEVAKKWVFPNAAKKNVPFSITLHVKKGVKFHIPLPGEERKTVEPAPQASGFLNVGTVRYTSEKK